MSDLRGDSMQISHPFMIYNIKIIFVIGAHTTILLLKVSENVVFP